MSQSSVKARSVTVDLPDEVFHRRSRDPKEIARIELNPRLLPRLRAAVISLSLGGVRSAARRKSIMVEVEAVPVHVRDSELPQAPWLLFQRLHDICS
jgi:hypothetical protein